MILWVLGIIDIIAGSALSLGWLIPYTGNWFIGTMATVLIIKGVWSIITAAANAFFFDVIGILDLVAGLLLLFTTFGVLMHFFIYIGIALILKGFYSLVAGMISAGR